MKHNARKSSAVQLVRHSEEDYGNALHGKHGLKPFTWYGHPKESTLPRPHLRDVSDTGVTTTDLRSLARSTPGTDQPGGRAQGFPALDTEGATVGDVPPTVARTETVPVSAIVARTETVPDIKGGTLAAVGSPASSGDKDVAKAVVEAACNLALQSHVPGVCEAAKLVSILVNLVLDDEGSIAEIESGVKRCRLLITILKRAAMVLGKVRRHESCHGGVQVPGEGSTDVRLFRTSVRLLLSGTDACAPPGGRERLSFTGP